MIVFHPLARFKRGMQGKPGTQTRSATQGFALLEALVALVIVSAVGTALFALINTGLQNLHKAENHATAVRLQPQVLAWVRSIELEQLPASHEASLSLWHERTEYQLNARFERMHGPVRALNSSGSPGIHEVALYNVTVRIYANDRQFDPIHTRRVHSHQVESPPEL